MIKLVLLEDSRGHSSMNTGQAVTYVQVEGALAPCRVAKGDDEAMVEIHKGSQSLRHGVSHPQTEKGPQQGSCGRNIGRLC